MNAVSKEISADQRGRGSAVERVVDHLREGILHGRYAPGQRLIEADLTCQLAVSRGPVREAFLRLSADGLIEIVPNRGAIVRRLSRRDTIELFQIRTALEGLAAHLAAKNMADACVRARFEAAIQPIWDDAPRTSSVAYIEENRVFHQAVIDASGNAHLAQVNRQLQLPLIMFQLSGALVAAVLNDSLLEHRQIAKAILVGDGTGAQAAVSGHLTRASRLSQGMPAAVFRK